MFIKNFTLCIRVHVTTLPILDLLNSNFYMFLNQILWVVIEKWDFSNI